MKQQRRRNCNVISKYRQNFYNLYHTRIVPIFSEFEQERKREFFVLICLEVVIAGILLTFIISTFASLNSILFLLFPFVIIACLLLLSWLPSQYNKKFVKKLKNNCMPKVVSVFENMRWYDCYKMISDTEILNSELFGHYNRRDSYDALEGIYKDVPFQIAETYIYDEAETRRTDLKELKSADSIFKGVIIKFKANKNIKNTTIIATKHDGNIKNRFSYRGVMVFLLLFLFYDIWTMSFGNFNVLTIVVACILILILIMIGVSSICVKNEALNEMKLEDPEFNKRYKAYSSNQIEGRYLITPAFIERFNNLQTAFGTNKAKCSFYGDEIMFAISTNENLFEIGNLFHSLNNPKQMEVFFNELSSILALVDYFKLDEKTGL